MSGACAGAVVHPTTGRMKFPVLWLYREGLNAASHRHPARETWPTQQWLDDDEVIGEVRSVWYSLP